MSIPWSGGIALLSSAQRTATPSISDIPVAWAARGLDLIIDITVNAGSSASLTVAINGKDPSSLKYYNLLTSAALSSVATTVLTVGLGMTAVGNVSANRAIPAILQIVVTHGNANPITYSVGLNLIS